MAPVGTISGEDDKSATPSAGSSDQQPQPQLWLSGSKASRHGWVRVCDGTERVFYHSIDTGKITLERPADFGDDNPVWADGKNKMLVQGSSSCFYAEKRETRPRTM